MQESPLDQVHHESGSHEEISIRPDRYEARHVYNQPRKSHRPFFVNIQQQQQSCRLPALSSQEKQKKSFYN